MSSIDIPISDLYARTIKLLMDRPRHLTLAMIETDTKIPVGWLRYFLANPNIHCSVHRVEHLYRYLAGKPKSLDI